MAHATAGPHAWGTATAAGVVKASPLSKLPGALSQTGPLCVVLALVLAALGVCLLEPIPVQNLRLAQFDQFQRWHPRVYTTLPVRIVDIDEAALTAIGQWPWPRSTVAQLIERLHAAGAATIALDVLLTEPDRNAPSAMARLWRDPAVTAALAKVPDPDEALGRSLHTSTVVLGNSLMRNAASPQPQPPPALPYRVIHSGDPSATNRLQHFDGALWPLPGLTANAQGVGALNPSPDSDGVLRRVPLVLQLGTHTVPSLVAEALRVTQGARNYIVRGTAAGVQDVRIGALTIPTNAQGEIWLHYTADEPSRYVSAARILDGTVAVEQLRGHMVLVGSSAAGLLDIRSNPLGQQMPGVQAHAMALEQILSGDPLQRPAWANGLEAVVLVLGALVAGLVALGAPARWATLTLIGVLALTGGGAWWAYVAHHWLLDASNPAWAMLLAFGVASGLHQRVTERQQRWLRTAFSRYVSPNRVEHLLAHPGQLHLGGKRQVCSFVFTDLAGFTPMLEASDPAPLVNLLNDYLEAMLVIAFKHEGTLDRFVGDAMVVLFSAPVTQEDHRQRALDCALEMDAFATAYAHRLQMQGVSWGLTRIGVHSGEVIVGNFGGKTLFDYRALGDPINTAARLEGANKHLGTRVCVSQAVLDGCSGVPVRPVGRLLLKGKSLPLNVFTPDSTLDPATCAVREDYNTAMQWLQGHPQQDRKQALAQFEAMAQRYPHDPLVALQLQRLRAGAEDDLIVLRDK